MFLSVEVGVPHDLERHAAYVDSWIRVLSRDKNELFRAARDAGRITDFMMNFAPELRVGSVLARSLDDDESDLLGVVTEAGDAPTVEGVDLNDLFNDEEVTGLTAR